jgi:hypothetical protein
MRVAALYSHFLVARPSLCVLEALRMIVSGATMTTPTQWGRHGGTGGTTRARRTGFLIGSEPRIVGAPTLRFAPLQAPRAVCKEAEPLCCKYFSISALQHGSFSFSPIAECAIRGRTIFVQITLALL